MQHLEMNRNNQILQSKPKYEHVIFVVSWLLNIYIYKWENDMIVWYAYDKKFYSFT